MKRILTIGLVTGALGSASGGCGCTSGGRVERALTTVNRDIVSTFKDECGNNFKVVWGADENKTSPVFLNAEARCNANASKLTLHLPDAADDYTALFTSSFPGGSFSWDLGTPCTEAQRRAWEKDKVPVWPIVCTTRISIGASGTTFIVHHNAATHDETIYRLANAFDPNTAPGPNNRPPGAMRVWEREKPEQPQPIDAEDNQDLKVVCQNGVPQPPVAATAEDTEFISGVLARAALKGVAVPRPDSPKSAK